MADQERFVIEICRGKSKKQPFHAHLIERSVEENITLRTSENYTRKRGAMTAFRSFIEYIRNGGEPQWIDKT